MAKIDKLSTITVPASQRFAYWQEIFAHADLSLDPANEPEAFTGTVTRLTLGEFQLTSVESSPLVSRSRVSAATQEGHFSLHLVHSGRCLLRHAGTEILADAGDMIVVDARRPYELTFKRAVQGLVIRLPGARFGSQVGALEKLAGRRLNRNSGPAAVLSSFTRSAWDGLVEGDHGEWPLSASDVIFDLLGSILRDDRAGQIAGSRADELRRKAAALVDRQLFDAEFRCCMIAEELGVSERYLQRVFADVGTTPTRFLLGRRLEAVAARLRYSDKPRRITDIALECGFSDLSYFSRTFRRRFEVSPRNYWRMQASGAPQRSERADFLIKKDEHSPR